VLFDKSDSFFNLFCRYAGWLGTVAARYMEDGNLVDVVPTLLESRHRLAAVAGTSTCYLVQVGLEVDMDLPNIFIRSYGAESRWCLRQRRMGAV